MKTQTAKWSCESVGQGLNCGTSSNGETFLQAQVLRQSSTSVKYGDKF